MRMREFNMESKKTKNAKLRQTEPHNNDKENKL